MAGLFPQAGFYYQNIVAAKHILESIQVGSNIVSIELDNPQKVQHVDDIIVTYKGDFTRYYQIKWSDDDSKSYTLSNLTTSAEDGEKPLIEQLATGYSRLPHAAKVEVVLYTTRRVGNKKQTKKGFSHSLFEFLQDVHSPYGNGDKVSRLSDLPNFTEYRETIKQLFEASKLNGETEFCHFLHDLRFQFSQPSIDNQREYLKARLDALGIERSLYDTLINAVVEWSLPPRQEINASIILDRLGLSERFIDRLVHDFKVNDRYYVENTGLFQKLDDAITRLDSGFIFLEGPPGSGKSTALTMYQRQRNEIRFTYYCYIPDEKYLGNARMEQESFLKSLCIGIQNAFPNIDFPQKYSQDYESKLNLWLNKLSQQGFKTILIVDGLDHVHRKAEANELAAPLTRALSGKLPPNIIVIISAQYIEALPLSTRDQIQNSDLRYIKITKFSKREIESYLTRRGIHASSELLSLVAEKSGGIPLYLHYIANMLRETSTYDYQVLLRTLPFLEDDNINSYHSYLFQSLSQDELTTLVLAILAQRKEYTDVKTLVDILALIDKKTSKFQAERTLSYLKHLLNVSDAKSFAIYHDSFRQFVLKRTQFMREEINEALLSYYQANPKSDETYRNYFNHLFELGRYQQILQGCNRTWLESSWQDFRPFREIAANLDLAWQAAIEIESFREFIRMAFLRYQFHLINYFVSETTTFKAHQFLLEIGKTQEALRIVWDGTSPNVPQREFAEFIMQYFVQTEKRIPDRIALAGLGEPHRPIKVDELKTYSTARVLYPEWIEHFDKVLEYKWAEEDRAQRHVKRDLSTDKNRAINDSIQISMLNGLYVARDYESLRQISSRTDSEESVRVHALFFAVDLLLQSGEMQEALKILSELDFSTLKQSMYNQFFLLLAEYNSLPNIKHLVNFSFLPPSLFDSLLEDKPEYEIKDELFELNDSLRVHFLQNANGYNVYMVKVNLYQQPTRGFLSAIIELAQLWSDTVLDRVDQASKLLRSKHVLDHLNIDKESINTSAETSFDRTFISHDIHRVYILLFDYLMKYLEPSEIIVVVNHWLSLDTGENGYKSSTTHLEFAKRLSKLAVSELNPSIRSLLERAEALSRLDEETSTLVGELLECAKSYGYCGFDADANRLWQEVYKTACGVNYRKDYQFNEAIAALELANKVRPDKSLSRLAKLLHLTHQLVGTGRATIPARALEYLIALASSIDLKLGLDLLYREDPYIFREDGIKGVINEASQSNHIDLRYLWAIVKTMDKWDDFNVYRDSTYPTMLSIFETILSRGDLDLASEIYDFCRHQFLVEKDRPESVYDFAEACQKYGYSVSTSLIDLQKFKALKDKAAQYETQSNTIIRSKETHMLKKPNYDELYLRSEQDFNSFSLEVENIYSNFVRAQRRRDLKRGYFSLQQLYEGWHNAQARDIQLRVNSYSIDMLREYVTFSKKVCEIPIQIHQNEYFQAVSELIEDLRFNVQNLISEEAFGKYFDEQFDVEAWLEDVTRGGLTSYEGEQEIVQCVFRLLENASLANLHQWERFCRRWLKHNELTKALIQIAKRIRKLNKEHSRELLLEAWDANSQFFYEYTESMNEIFSLLFDLAPGQAKRLLLQSFYYEHQRYPGSIIHRLDTISKFAAPFESEDFYDYVYLQYEQHNELLTLGLSEKSTDYSWVVNHIPECSPEDAIIQYLVHLLDYPEVEIRKLALRALYGLIQHNKTTLIQVLTLCDGASDNGKEHILSLVYTIAVANPDWVLPLRSSLMRLLDYPHFNIKQTAKEILLYCVNRMNSPLEQWEIDKILMTNVRPEVLVPKLLESGLQRGRQFILSRYQSALMYKLHNYQNDDSVLAKLYTRLLYMGWNKRDGIEQETRVHHQHNINTNFDVVEINGPYFQATQEAINFLVNKEITEQVYDNEFIKKIRFDFRLYDPTDPLVATYLRPSDINRVDAALSVDQFLGFEDLINLSDGWKFLDDEWITLYESGHQRLGDRHTSDPKQTCYFTLVSFLVSSSFENTNFDLVSRLKNVSPFIHLENVYRHELPSLLPNSRSFPLSGIKPIIGVSERAFRGQDELSIAALLPDFAEELQLLPTETLNYKRDSKTLGRLYQWQEKYDQDRRRQKPVAAGIRLQIKKQALHDFLQNDLWNVYYAFYVRRSINNYSPEGNMSWVNFSGIGKLAWPDGTLAWLS